MRYSVDKEAKKLHYLIAAVFLIFGLFGIYHILTSGDIADRVFMFVWFVGAMFAVRYILKQPTNIEFDEALGKLTFSNKLKSFSCSLRELEKIECSNQDLSFIFQNDKVSMSHQITGLHVLVTDIKKINPQIIIKGC